MKLVNYLWFRGNCEEAITFYQAKLGAKLLFMMRFKDMPDNEEQDCDMPPEMAEKVMHATLMLGESELMMCDNPQHDDQGFNGFSISIAADDQAQAEKLFSALSEDGEITMPLEPTFWAEAFGMVTDKFGVNWMVNLASDDAPQNM